MPESLTDVLENARTNVFHAAEFLIAKNGETGQTANPKERINYIRQLKWTTHSFHINSEASQKPSAKWDKKNSSNIYAKFESM